MIGFLHPEAFLLALPLLIALRSCLRTRPTIVVLRVLALFAALAILADPYRHSENGGRDLILVVDRSESVGGRAADIAGELLGELVDAASDGSLSSFGAEPEDRIGVVSFGRDTVVEVPPVRIEDLRLPQLDRPLDTTATDLGSGLDRALGLVPASRSATWLLISDGEGTNRLPLDRARAIARRNGRLDAFRLQRPELPDLVVESLQVPSEIGTGEPFQIAAWVRVEQAGDIPFRVSRGNQVLSEGSRRLEAGLQRVVFNDLLAEPGVHRYRVEFGTGQDPVPENDRALAVLRAVGGDRTLLISPAGREGALASALRQAGLTVDIRAPIDAPLTLDRLEGYQVVVLENVPAGDLPSGSLRILRDWVSDSGGGLVMTGGRSSFGLGGYRASPVEDVLPVSLEIRQEQRRFGLAMAIALDRSGSMSASTAGGRTKMDLANLGTIAALELLGPIDSAAVIAVDSAPHVILPLQDVDNRRPMIERVSRIESMGGGIYVFEALTAMAEQLRSAQQATKHMVLFADAADAEQPGLYRSFVPELRKAGVSLSVIGLGSDTDSDAAFLKDLASLGGGRATFVRDAAELPRVFAQETLQVARSSFADEPVALQALPDLIGLGDLPNTAPSINGYSIAYAKPGASIGMRSVDEVRAPVLSFWQAGVGRSVAFLGEADGRFTGALASDPGYTDLFATIVRWAGGSEADEEVWSDLRREGHEGVLTIEVPEGEASRLEAVRAVLRREQQDSGAADANEIFLRRVDEHRLEARFPLVGGDVHRVAVQVGEDQVQLPPPIALPYSPEFEPRFEGESGGRSLRRLVEAGEGTLEPLRSTLFSGPRVSRGSQPIGVWFAGLLLGLLLLEIAVRRLDLRMPGLSIVQRALSAVRPRRDRSPAEAPQPGQQAKPRAVRTKVLRPSANAAETAEEQAPDSQPTAQPETPPERDGLDAILSRAKRGRHGSR